MIYIHSSDGIARSTGCSLLSAGLLGQSIYYSGIRGIGSTDFEFLIALLPLGSSVAAESDVVKLHRVAADSFALGDHCLSLSYTRREKKAHEIK